MSVPSLLLSIIQQNLNKTSIYKCISEENIEALLRFVFYDDKRSPEESGNDG